MLQCEGNIFFSWNYHKGYIDEFHINKGGVSQVENFTRPTSPY